MFNGFDHAILGVGDLARAEANFHGLGFTVTARPDTGATETENRLVCFADGSYIEIFSLRDATRPSAHRWAPMLARGDGWVDYAVRVEDVAAEAQRLSQTSLPNSGLRSAGRTLTDGRRWGVAVLLLGRGVGNPLLPFLIQDTEAREARVPADAAAVQPHRITGIAGVTLVTAALSEPVLAAIFGPGLAIPPRVAGATAARRYGFAGRWVEVIEADAAATSMASEHLRSRGEGVFEVTVGQPGKTQPGDGDLLAESATHGARLRVGT